MTPKERTEDRKIETIYGRYCAGMQITMTRIPQMFRIARAMLRQGESDERIGNAMVAFVKQEEV